MTRIRGAIRVAAALCVAQPGLAQDVDCTNAQTQVEMTYCAEQDWMAQDAELNAAYRDAQAVMKRIDAGISDAERGASMFLRDAQRAWVEFRDAACAAEGYTWRGGSGEAMVIYACRARLTRQRSADLWELARAN